MQEKVVGFGFRSTTVPIHALAALIAVGALVLLALVLWSSFTRGEQERRDRVVLLARLAEASLTRTVESVETALLSVTAELESGSLSPWDMARVEESLSRRLRFAPHIRQLVLLDGDRILANTSGPIGDRVDVEALFPTDPATSPLALGISIGERVPGRFIPIIGAAPAAGSRALVPIKIPVEISGRGGRYRLIAALNTFYIDGIFATLDLDDTDQRALLRTDGVVLTGDAPTGAAAAVANLVRSGSNEQVVARATPGPASDSLVLRLSEKYPLAITVLVQGSGAAAAWYRGNWVLIWGLAAAVGVIVAAVIALIVEFRQASRLRDEVILLSAAAEQSPQPMLITNTDNRVTYVNPAFERTFGHIRAKAVGRAPTLLPRVVAPGAADMDPWAGADDAEPWSGELTVRKRNSALIDVALTVFPVRDADGHVSNKIASFTDLTARRAAERHINLLSQVVEQSPVMVMITDVSGVIEYVNREFEAVTGYGREEVVGANPRILNSGQNNPALFADLWRSIGGGETWSGEILNRKKDGGLYWVRIMVRPLTNAAGAVTNHIAIKEDITGLRESQHQLRLSAAVFQTATEGIMISDRVNNIRMVNAAFTEITGYAADEVLGRDPSLLASGRHDAAFFETMYRDLGQTGRWQGEIWNRRKDGVVFPEWLTISVLRDEAGEPDGYVALFSDITARKRDEESIMRQANFDALTGLPNRNLFQDRLARALYRARRQGTSVALFFIDLDHFKKVNDTLGHMVGDKLLVEAAHRIQGRLRESDTAARLGGDEFAAILPDLSFTDGLESVARDILEDMARPFRVEGHDAHVSGSIGITLFPTDGDDAATLIRNADSAMYRAKAGGRDAFRFFTREMSERAQRRRQLELALFRAVERREFRLVFQPIIDARSNRVAYAEALLRWTMEDGSEVSPGEFIPVAEETGVITQIGEWAFREACRAAAAWSDRLDDPPGVSVNVSGRQVSRTDIASLAKDICAETGLTPDRLIVEITENVLLSSEDAVARQLKGLRDLGAQVAIDDFGTGYSSISYLKKFAISALKIDRTFVHGLPADADDCSLILGILKMAGGMNLKTVAEGVETEEQLRFLVDNDCSLIQGFHFARPIPNAAFIEFVERWGRE